MPPLPARLLEHSVDDLLCHTIDPTKLYRLGWPCDSAKPCRQRDDWWFFRTRLAAVATFCSQPLRFRLPVAHQRVVFQCLARCRLTTTRFAEFISIRSPLRPSVLNLDACLPISLPARRNRTMKRLLSLGAAILMMAGATGCGCCGLTRGRTQTVAMPCTPACNTCAPCDSCGYGSGPVYGGEVYSQPTVAPGATFGG